MKAWVLVCVLASTGLWIWARSAPVEAASLEPKFCRTYRLYRFEPPPGVVMNNPYPEGQTWFYELKADGTFLVRVLLVADFEMSRSEGRASHAAGKLTLERMSTDRREDRAPPDVYDATWAQDAAGEYLLLRHSVEGHSLYLRPVNAPPAD